MCDLLRYSLSVVYFLCIGTENILIFFAQIKRSSQICCISLLTIEFTLVTFKEIFFL